MRTARCALFFISVSAVAFAAAPPEILGSIGYFRAFLDEQGEFAGGAAVRLPVSRRLAIRPEFVASNQPYYTHALAVGGATFDVTDPDKRIVTYVSGGAGFVRTNSKSIDYSYTEGLGMVGLGVRFLIGNRWIAGSEFRLGTSGFPLITFNLGIRLGER